MAVIAVSAFERMFSEAADLDVDKNDLKRYQDFVHRKLADLLTRAEATAKANGRDVIELSDLPITKGLQESIHEYRRLDQGPGGAADARGARIRPLLDLAVADETDAALPEIAGALSVRQTGKATRSPGARKCGFSTMSPPMSSFGWVRRRSTRIPPPNRWRSYMHRIACG